MPLVTASIPIIGPIVSTLGGAVGSIFSTIGGAILGAFTWTIGLATKFILTTIAALVKMLIPHAWVHKGLQIMQWIVAVPDYAGKVTSPGGGHVYGFAGINALRDVFTWLGVAIAPLTLVYATSRAMIGECDPVGIPVLRILAVTAVIVSYPYWWSQAAALVDQITNTILSVPAVSRGLYKLMEYAVDGVALGGWQLIDLGLMGAIGLELIGLIFLKVVVILLGALLYATGPVTIGLVPTRAGSALARAWASAAVALLLLGDRVGDAVRGRRAVDRRLGDRGSADRRQQRTREPRRRAAACCGRAGEPVAVPEGRARGLEPSAAAALRSARPRRPASTRRPRRRPRAPGGRPANHCGSTARALAVRRAPRAASWHSRERAAGQSLAPAAPLATSGRRGLIGTAAGAAGRTAAAAPARGAVFARSRPGAVAVRMARAGTASWQTKPNPGTNRPEARTAAAAAQVANATRQNPSRGRPGRRAATTGGRSDAAPTSSAHTRSSSGARTAPPNGNGSPGGAPHRIRGSVRPQHWALAVQLGSPGLATAG